MTQINLAADMLRPYRSSLRMNPVGFSYLVELYCGYMTYIFMLADFSILKDMPILKCQKSEKLLMSPQAQFTICLRVKRRFLPLCYVCLELDRDYLKGGLLNVQENETGDV